MFLSPLNKQKQRFGELEFEYFGGSDVANKLLKSGNTEKQHLPQIGSLFAEYWWFSVFESHIGYWILVL